MVVDTSVLMEALVPGQRTAQARAFFNNGGPLRAPDLLPIELAGALTRAVRRRDVDREFAAQSYATAKKLFPPLEDTSAFLDRSFVLSLELLHPVADCVFLAQAEARADTLVTVDAHFLRKLAGTPHQERAVHLADWRP